jgi:hypothetical protein
MKRTTRFGGACGSITAASCRAALRSYASLACARSSKMINRRSISVSSSSPTKTIRAMVNP